MAGAQTNVDPEGIWDAGNRMRYSAEHLRAELGAFQSELAGFGEPWGGDELGSLIGMCYSVIRDVAMESYQDNIDGVGEHGDGVQVMAANYADSDERSAQRISAAGGM